MGLDFQPEATICCAFWEVKEKKKKQKVVELKLQFQ